MTQADGTRAGPQARAPWHAVPLSGTGSRASERAGPPPGGGAAAPNGGAAPLQVMALPGIDADGQPVHFVLLDRPLVREGAGWAPRFSLVLTLSRRPRPDEEDVVPLVRSGVLALELTLGLSPDLRAAYERSQGVRCEPIFTRAARMELRGGEAREPLATQEASGPSPAFALQAALDRAGALEVLRALDGIPGSLSIHTAVDFRAIDEPPPASRGSITVQRVTAETRSFESTVALHELLGGLLAGFDRDRFVRMVAPGDTDGGGFFTRHVASTRAAPGDGEGRLTALDGGVSSLTGSMRPAPLAVHATSIVASDVAHPTLAYAAAGRVVHHWELDDLVVDDVAGALARLPVVDDPSAAIWHDRIDANRYWYAPAFELVTPQGSDTAAQSPFLFRYWRVGASAGGAPVLRATVRFTLRQTMSAATRQALNRPGGPPAQPVAVTNLGVSLIIPYVDATDGKLKTTTLLAAVTAVGDALSATVELLDPVVRCSYGAMAVPGFQSTPPRIAIAYTYQCYVPVKPGKLNIVAGGKRSLIPLAGSARERSALGSEGYFDAGTATFRSPAGEVRLAREAPAVARMERRPLGAIAVAAQPAVATHAATVATAVQPAPAVAVATAVQPVTLTPMYTAHAMIARPPVSLSVALADALRKTQYSRRTLAREDRLDAVFPCSGLGGFYCEGADVATARAVGCVDALRLGQASLRLYDEMPELANPSYRVYRALQQPGQFLVLPASYRITRFGSSVPNKAYRPAICMYSAIDATTPANNRVVYYATLEPDIAPHLRRALELRLRREAPNPVLSYPTELAAAASYDWTVGTLLKVEPEVIRAPDHFQVSLATDVPGALLLRTILETSGVYGAAHFALSDGTTLTTALALELTHIIGPSSGGPIEVTLDGGSARLVNRVERALDVSDVLLMRSGAAALEAVPVEARLESGATTTVPITGAASEGYAAAADPGDVPVSLEEIRSFVEDVHTNVIFIDLVNHANHNLRSIAIQARLKNVPGTTNVAMSGDPPRGTVEFLLPLSTYLANSVLQFSVRKSFTSGPDVTTPWLDWDLERDGNVVSMSWELIG